MNHITPALPELLSIDEACAALRMSKPKFYRMTKSGDFIPKIVIGRSVFYKQVDVLQFIENCMVP